MKDLIIITGPTGSGKSEVAIELAKVLNTEIISADSVQVYKELDIGSGKVLEDERQGIIHHLIDCICPNEEYSVQRFQNEASSIIHALHQKGKVPIVCGGSSLYIHSLLYKLDFSQEKKDEKLRNELEKIRLKYGREHLFTLLEDLDPEKAKEIDKNNHRRVIRAIEIAKSGKKMNYKNFREKNDLWNFHYFILTRDRGVLYSRVNQRVLNMVKAGLFEEVNKLIQKYGPNICGLKTIGYKEIVSYYNEEYTKEEAIEKIQQHSRNLAKRQLTWYRKEEDSIPIYIEEEVSYEIAKKIYKLFQREGK